MYFLYALKEYPKNTVDFNMHKELQQNIFAAALLMKKLKN